jgi:hypothetical protein
MTDTMFTEADADALAAKLDACDLTDAERALLVEVFRYASADGGAEVAGFSMGLPFQATIGPQIFSASQNSKLIEQNSFGLSQQSPTNNSTGSVAGKSTHSPITIT